MKRFIAILLLCLVVGTSVAAQTPRQNARAEIGSTRIAIATAIRLLQWRFGILPTGDLLIPPFPGPTSDLLIPRIPRSSTTNSCK